jgi:capsular polysaccharide biosynthesis protein
MFFIQNGCYESYIKTHKKGDLMNNQTSADLLGTTKVKEIDIKEHITLIKKRFWVIILLTIITTSLGFVKSTMFTTPLYQSSTRLIIGADTEQMKTLQVLMKDPTVLQKVISDLGISRSPEGLAQQISVYSVDGSQVVSLNVVDTNPALAADIANATANAFKSEIPNIVGFSNVKLLTEAKVNPFPINSNQNRDIMIAFMMGVILGIGIIYFLESLDDSVKSEEEIESILGVSVLGTVSKMNKKNMKKNNGRKSNMEVRGESVGY